MSKFAKVKPFWMIYNLTRGGPPTRIHAEPWVADAEARRLAQKHPGDIFVILQAVRATVSADSRTPSVPWPG